MAFSRDAKTEYDTDTSAASDTSATFYVAAVKDKNGTQSDVGVSHVQLAAILKMAGVAGPVFSKAIGSTEDFHVDLSDWLDADTISDVEISVPAGITKVSESYTDTLITVYLSGGASGGAYDIVFIVDTAGGRRDYFYITIEVDGDGAFTKHPDSVLDYVLDLEDWLAGDTLNGLTVTVPSGIGLDSSSYTSTTATAWVSGGTANSDYSILYEYTTTGGRSDSSTITIQVRDPKTVNGYRYEKIVTESTSPYTVGAGETNSMYTNTGSTDTVVLDLPAATRGLEYEVASEAAQQIRLNVNGSDVIDLLPGYTLGAGRSTASGTAGSGLISTGTAGEFVAIRCFFDGQWVVTYSAGDWYDSPRLNLDTGSYSITGTVATLVPA